MGITETLSPATGMFSGALGTLSRYWWILIPFAVMLTIGAIVFVIKKVKKKNSQWTHKLLVRRVLDNNLLSETIVHRMRRFPLIKRAGVFELEKPLLGSYLIPELDEYSGLNTYSIILDKNNRIYTNKGEFFVTDKSNVNVSAKHSEIDIQIENLKANFQNVNKISKRVEWATIAKYAFLALALIGVTIVLIVWIQKQADAQQYKAQQAQAESQAMDNLAKAIEQSGENSKVNILIMDRFEKLFGKQNLQNLLNEK